MSSADSGYASALPIRSKPEEHASTSVAEQLIPLRTKAEVEAANATTEVYVVRIPRRSASGILDLLKDVVPADTLNSLQHVRRVIKPDFCPPHLREEGHPHRRQGRGLALSYLVICQTQVVERIVLHGIFNSPPGPPLFRPLIPNIRVITVPAQAPTSAAQADMWSEKYWPISYKNTNPYGPHPAIVRRAELEILCSGMDDHANEGHAGDWMQLAFTAGKECKDVGYGTGAGAVVVDRSFAEGKTGQGKEAKVVAIAGDARFASAGFEDCAGGNITGHAVMRAIALVASKRRTLARNNSGSNTPTSPTTEGFAKPDFFLDKPLTDKEAHYLAQTSMAPNGYLCVDLELYLTHEPCIMCSMAILHSRFGRVIFAKASPKTGALTTEPTESVGSEDGSTLAYGLFWRPELNWKCLAWKWNGEALGGEPEEGSEVAPETHM